MTDGPLRIKAVREATPQEAAYATDGARWLGPEESLVRVEATAKLVFANVAAVAVVLSGFGFLDRVGDALARGPQILGAPLAVVLVVISLVLATIAVTPRLRRLHTQDPNEIKRFYDGQIRRRGSCALAAMAVLVAAMLAAVNVAADAAGSGDALTLDTRAVYSRGAVAVSASAAAGQMPSGESLRLRMIAGRHVICDAVAGPDDSQRASVSCPRAKRTRRVVVEATTIRKHGGTDRRQSRSFRP